MKTAQFNKNTCMIAIRMLQRQILKHARRGDSGTQTENFKILLKERIKDMFYHGFADECAIAIKEGMK